VGEYTKPGKTRKKTVPFIVGDVTFRTATGQIIPNSSSLSRLLQAHEATLRIDNQKNSSRGQTIHQECTGNNNSPVKALARQVHHILSNGGSAHTGIYTYYTRPNRPGQITQHAINKAIKQAAKGIGLLSTNIGYEEADVSSHSLRAGGALAMHLGGSSVQQIKIQGRWKSATFENYIHEQISAFSAGLSTKMSRNVPFRQIAGPTVRTPDAAAA